MFRVDVEGLKRELEEKMSRLNKLDNELRKIGN